MLAENELPRVVSIPNTSINDPVTISLNVDRILSVTPSGFSAGTLTIESPFSDSNIGEIHINKDGTDISSVIPVKMYYADGAASGIRPRAWQYASAFTDPGQDVESFNESALLKDIPTQNFPVTIWNTTGKNSSRRFASSGRRRYSI